MVKANAYGHGSRELVRFASEHCEIRDFGLASIAEFEELKGLEKLNFWIFSELDLKNKIDLYKKYNLTPVISCLEDLSFWLKEFGSSNFALKFDTGMNRLGLKETELESVCELLEKSNMKNFRHIMTHFSSSYFEIKENSVTENQYKKFKAIKENLNRKGITFEESSCSNSGAIEQSFGLEESHIRPGLMLYGPASFGVIGKGKSNWSGEIISCLRVKAIKQELFKKGTPIGYGGTKLTKDAYVVYLPIGYGDGILTYYTGAKVRSGKHIGEIFGRVNMDLTAVIFSEEVDLTEEITIWDSNLPEFAAQVRSIPYQVLTTVTRRVPKKYKY